MIEEITIITMEEIIIQITIIIIIIEEDMEVVFTDRSPDHFIDQSPVKISEEEEVIIIHHTTLTNLNLIRT